MTADPQFLVILARQRTGTHVLRKMLDTDPKIRDVGEVISSKNPDGLHKYLLAEADDVDFTFTKPEMYSVFDRALSSYSAGTPEATIILDVKYTSMSPFNGYGHSVMDPPAFLQFCFNNDIPIIHLLRRDILASLASEKYAVRRKLWHLERSDTPPEHTPISISPHLAKRDFSRVVGEVLRFRQFLKGERATTLFYEDMFNEDGTFSLDTVRKIEALLQRPLKVDLTPGLRVVSGSPRDYVSNFDQISTLINSSEGLMRRYHGAMNA